MSSVSDLQILTQLHRGWYLNRCELQRAKQLVQNLKRELESRIIGPLDVPVKEEPDHGR
jgi:hypothetical protein